MKKIILIATCAASISAYAIPTYEPFTEYTAAIAASGSNAIDLCTSGAVLPSGDAWGCLVFTGTFGTNIIGLDILVTNNPGLFTATALATGPILPTTFPGYPATGQSITNVLMNPAQPLVGGAVSANIVGNSAVLKFANDITRPASGTKTVYMSYLWSLVGAGQIGGGNDARYLNFVAATNLVEGKGTSGFYQTWASMLDTLPGTCIYGANAVIAGGSGFYNVACDNSTGKEFTSTPFTSAYGKVQFIVSAYTFTAVGSGLADSNSLWVNPSVSSFGGPTPPASPIFVDTMPHNMSDIGGLVIDDRPGKGASAGGIDSNYMANLMLGSTWSFVTGGPEFTTQPSSPSPLSPGNNVIVGPVVAVAAGQTVTYQWTHAGTNVNNGAFGASGAATVFGATTASLTLNGVSTGDAGNYAAVATASGTGFTLASSNAVLIVADPGILLSPSPATANAGGTASFTAQAETTSAKLTYAWYHGAAMLTNGLQADGSTAIGAQGTNGTGTSTLTLTLTNVVCADDGSYTLFASNATGSSASTIPASLTVTDPYITVQPPATTEISATEPNPYTTIAVTAAGTGLTYQWTIPGGANGNGEITGLTLSTLTIANANSTSADAGTYSVVVSGSCGSPVTSANTIVYYDATAPSGAGVTPPALTQQTGTHLALIGTITNTGNVGGAVDFIWTFNNGTSTTTLANGTQADGSWVSGAGAQFVCTSDPFVQSSPLVLSNLQVTDSGTYTLIASNAAGTVASLSSSVVTVSSGLLALSTNNLEVTRVGEGSEALSGATGNTLYLDQIETNGAYVSTIMVPDTGTATLIVPGGPPSSGLDDSYNESYLTLSSNNDYLNFIGYFWTYPYTGGATVTVGSASFAYPRAIGAVNGLGYYVLAYTNGGICSGGNAFVRTAYSTDGLINFWVAGAAGSSAIKYVNAGPLGAGYASGSGVPALSTAVTGPRCLGLAVSSLVYSDEGDTVTPAILGLNEFPGAAPTINEGTTQILTGGVGHPADFAFSPDGNTVYVADDEVTSGASGNGGIQRWDLESGAYQYSYNLYDSTGIGTNGMRGLTVYFPPQTYGQYVLGAVLYATTSEVVANRLITITDNGASSTSTLLDTAGPNQFFRGVRFGPASIPVTLVTGPQSDNTYVGQSDTLTVSVTGDAPFYYQWQFDGTNIQGATTSSLVLSNLQATNSGTYSVIVSNAVTAPQTSSAVVSVTSGPAVLIAGPQSLVETVGDHTAFTVTATGTLPINYQWYSNGVTIASATTTALSLSNIVVANSATYSVVFWNTFNTLPYPSNSATLRVTTALQSLASTNLVVARVGDGVQALSTVTGNTLYLDQLTTNNIYSNTIMIPDNAASGGNLIVVGGSPYGLWGSALTRSVNSNYLNFVGFNTPYPATTFNVPTTLRSIEAVNAFGYYQVAQDNQTIYDAIGNEAFNSAVSLDGYAEFWTTGSASSGGGIKYAPASAAVAGGTGNAALGGSSAGTRVVNIVAGNVVYTDASAAPVGIWAFSGEPTATAGTANLIADAAGNPDDFAASPDTSGYPPTTSTVYLCDSSTIANGGGIQRYDWNGSAYALSYTLGTGTGSTVGAGCLTVDFSAQTTWGPGVTGAIIYATTAAASSNQLIRVVDTGAGSSATVMKQANVNELLRGVRFGPVPSAPIIVSLPQPASVSLGGTTNFTTAAQNGPFTYQWQLNGTNLTNGSSVSGSGATISGAQSASLTVASAGIADNAGSYTVVVSNPYGAVTSTPPALLTVLAPPQFTTSGAGPLTLTGPGSGQLNFSGPALTTYHIWSTTNLSLTPVDTTWTLVGAGTFSGGADSFPISVTETNEFYVLTQP